MLPEDKKTGILMIRVHPTLRARVDAEVDRTGSSAAEVMRRALSLYLDKREAREEGVK